MLQNNFLLKSTEKQSSDNLQMFKKQIKLLQDDKGAIHSLLEDPKFNGHFMNLCDGLLNYVDNLEQDLFDLRVVLNTTVEHGTAIENEFSEKQSSTEKALEQYQYIFNSSKEWMCLIDKKDEIAALNDAFCLAFDQPKKKMVGVNLGQLFDKKIYGSKIKPSIRKAFKGVETRDQIEFQLPDGTINYLELAYYPFQGENHKASHVVIVGRNITKRKENEDTLAAKASFVDKIQEAIFVHDEKGEITFWNKSAEKLYGWKQSEVLGKNVWKLLFKKEEYLIQKEKVFYHLMKKDEWCGQLQHVSKDNKSVMVDSHWVNLQSFEGANNSVLVTNVNVTEKKQLEHQFFRVQRIESIGSLASGIAHDLNNVLTLFYMSVRALQPKLKDAQSLNILSLLEANAKRGVSLVRQILMFARGIEGEQMELDIIPLFSEIENIVVRTFPKNITIENNISEKLWKVYGNPTQLHQVLLNLCVNSRDAMANGGVIYMEAKNIELTAAQCKSKEDLYPGAYISIIVRDNGTGIPKEVQKKIFEPFFTTKETGRGTGLGLSTVMTIIKNHSGYVSLKSSKSKGAEFKIYLPATLSHNRKSKAKKKSGR